MWMPVTDPIATLPALSVTLALAVSAVPSPCTTVSFGQAPEEIPESASEHVQRTLTSPRYHPLAFGGVVTVPMIIGATGSTLIPSTVTPDVFPALSVARLVTLWFAPALSVTGLGQPPVAIPERPSVQVNETSVGAVCQPLWTVPPTLAFIVGGVLSIETTAESVTC